MVAQIRANRICELAFAAVLGISGLGLDTAFAGSSAEATFLQQEITTRVPSKWQVHVSARENALVIFLMPPYQEAFNLWYEPEKLRAKMLALCPGPGDAIWTKLPPEHNVAIEPTVGGKSAEAMRLVCPRTAPPA